MAGDIVPTEGRVAVSSDMVKNRGLHLYSKELGFSDSKIFINTVCPAERATILDMGSGEGKFSIDMIEIRPLWKIMSLDLEPKGGTNQVKADFSRLPFANSSVDAVVGSNSLGMYATSPDTIKEGLLEVKRVLKPGGKLLINIFAPLNTDDLSAVYGDQLDNPVALKKLRKTNFSIYTVDRTQHIQGPLLEDLLSNGFKLQAIRKSLSQPDGRVYAIEAVKI
jgi:SAM-dependent methyltransferase